MPGEDLIVGLDIGPTKICAIIGQLDLAGYFLIVWDLVRYCRTERILAQGRGSAANSAVCYSLGITAVDPIGMELLFERAGDSMQAAISSAIADVERAGYSVSRVELEREAIPG